MPFREHSQDPATADIFGLPLTHAYPLHVSESPQPPILLKAVDYISFPRVIGELLRVDPQFSNVEYTADFPKQRPNAPLIAYRLLRRTPGMNGVERYKPRLRFWFTNEDLTITEIWSQWMSCLYQFDICASSSDEADDLVYKFDTFLRNNVGKLLALGASEVVFEEQLEDALLPNTEDIVVRSIRWLARLEQMEFRNEQSLSQVNIRVFEPSTEDYEPVVRQDTIDIPDQLVQTYITQIEFVSDYSPSGIARTMDYVPNVDFLVVYDTRTNKTMIKWLEPGKRPAPGTTYYVRYLHWTAFARLRVPFF